MVASAAGRALRYCPFGDQRMKVSSAKDGRCTTDAEGLQEALAPSRA
jgi:hypothetical protein